MWGLHSTSAFGRCRPPTQLVRSRASRAAGASSRGCRASSRSRSWVAATPWTPRLCSSSWRRLSCSARGEEEAAKKMKEAKEFNKNLLKRLTVEGRQQLLDSGGAPSKRKKKGGGRSCRKPPLLVYFLALLHSWKPVHYFHGRCLVRQWMHILTSVLLAFGLCPVLQRDCGPEVDSPARTAPLLAWKPGHDTSPSSGSSLFGAWIA